MRKAFQKNTGVFPAIKTPQQLEIDASFSRSKLPTKPNTAINLRDLSWEDRERVLRLLFAKINGIRANVSIIESPRGSESRDNMSSLNRPDFA